MSQISSGVSSPASSCTASYVLGFDVSKAKLDYSLVDGNGVEQLYGVVLNTVADIAAVVLTVQGCYVAHRAIAAGVVEKKKVGSAGCDQNLTTNQTAGLTTVVEATSCYHYPLLEATEALGIPCRVYNPIITKSGIKASVRGKKTDRADALLIARMGLRGEGRIHTPEPYMTTKHYARSCQKLSILSSSFRQYKTHISELLEGELTPDTVEVLEYIQQAIKQARKQLYKDLAESAKGPIFTRLQTVPGIGPYVAASLIGEIQTMERFKKAHSLTAYAGLDPRVRQSGKALNSTGRLSKRGSSYLRRSLFIAASVAKRCDPDFKALYDKKRAEGKPYKVAVCVVARKLLGVVRAVWLSDTNYEVGRWPDEDR